MADFKRVKNENPEMKQSQIANQIGLSTSTLQNYRNDINMLSPYKINPNNIKKRTKKLQKLILMIYMKTLTSKDPKRPQSTSMENVKSSKNKKKNIVRAGSVHDKVEINEHYLDEIVQNKYF